MNPIDVFIQNLEKLMLKNKISITALSLHSGVSRRMIDYIIKKQRKPSIEIIDAIGMVFELEAWEMLHPTQGDIV